MLTLASDYGRHAGYAGFTQSGSSVTLYVGVTGTKLDSSNTDDWLDIFYSWTEP
jgi:hypothetical protein